MTESQPERRHLTRIPFDAEFRISVDEGTSNFSGRVMDLSLKGALIERPENLPFQLDEKFFLDLLLGSDGLHIQMQVRVAHLHEHSIGVICEHLDLESMTHLCRFLELNLGSHDLLERELGEMIEFKTH